MASDLLPACIPTPPIIPLPYAWYVSGDLIFELYDGGQPSQNFSIRWEHLKPIAKLAEPPAKLSQERLNFPTMKQEGPDETRGLSPDAS